MKRHGNLWNKVVDIDNLRLAFKKAAENNHDNRTYQKVIKYGIEPALEELQKLLKSGKFHTSEYFLKVIHEPKKRTIYILPFYPDRIVHHAIMNVLEPIWDGLLISDVYSCRKGKGQHAGVKKSLKLCMNFEYCLKCDIHHFYPSVKHTILKAIIRRKIKDKRLLRLIDDIIDSIPGDTNVPIGNLMSQWFGNIYLNELDEWVKSHLGFKNYVRYCDDFLFFSNSKEELVSIAKFISKFLERNLALTLSKCDLFHSERGVDFLGYRVFPNGVTLVRKSTAKRFKRTIRRLPKELSSSIITIPQALSRVSSIEGWISHANGHHLSLSMNIPVILFNLKRMNKYYYKLLKEGETDPMAKISDIMNLDEINNNRPDYLSHVEGAKLIKITDILGERIRIEYCDVFLSKYYTGSKTAKLVFTFMNGVNKNQRFYIHTTAKRVVKVCETIIERRVKYPIELKIERNKNDNSYFVTD